MKLLWTVLDIVPGTEIFSRSFGFHADADAVHFIVFFLIFSPSMMPSNVQRYSYSLFLPAFSSLAEILFVGFATFLPWYLKAVDYINNLMLLVKKVGSDKYISRI